MAGESDVQKVETSEDTELNATHNLLVVSDLHIGEGLESDGKLNRNEDFLYDKEFAHFLVYHERKRQQANDPKRCRPWRLILNGDVVDFLQVTEVPENQEIPYKYRRWGLGSTEKENVWRMYRIYEGHPIFFQGLAWFLAMGNEIVIQTGNHDIELFWREVRDAFRDIIQLAHGQLIEEDWRLLLATFGYDPNKPYLVPDGKFPDAVRSKLAFTHWIYYEPGVAYIEHGCQYETANSWPTYLSPEYITPFTSKETDQLFWPWGSLIVRYIFNRIEQIHPFADQIKPITRYLAWAFKNDLFRAIWLTFLSIPAFCGLLDKFCAGG